MSNFADGRYIHAPRKQNYVHRTDNTNTDAPWNNLNKKNKRRHELNADG